MNIDSGFAYRLPGDHIVHSGIGEARPGFFPAKSYVIAPFFSPADGIISISSCTEASLEEVCNVAGEYVSDNELYPLKWINTSKQQHHDAVAKIVDAIADDSDVKTISARLVAGSEQINPLDTFKSFCQAFPDAYVFLFYTPFTGCWIGASPEILLSADNGVLSTCALAGTRPAGTSGSWDEKNLNEQKIVRNFIKEIFVKWNMTPDESPLSTRRAGNVEHLFSLFSYSASEKFKTDPVRFLSDLSPTPALCGFPRDFSIRLISETEIAPRGYYGGFSGWIEDIDNFHLYVNLRSVKFTPKGWNMFAGGGITKDSIPDEEWMETERKYKGIMEKVSFS